MLHTAPSTMALRASRPSRPSAAAPATSTYPTTPPSTATCLSSSTMCPRWVADVPSHASGCVHFLHWRHSALFLLKLSLEYALMKWVCMWHRVWQSGSNL